MLNTTNIDKYRRLAPVYDRLFGNRWVTQARRQALALLPPLPAGARVLLVGVGTGADVLLVPGGGPMVGIDLSEAMLQQARRAISRSGRRVLLAEMNAERLGFADGQFDLVGLGLVLSVVEDGRRALAEAARVARPGAYLLIFDKFLAEGTVPSPARRLLNAVTTRLGTDVTRHLGALLEGQPLERVAEDRTLLWGFYRGVLLRKAAQDRSASGETPFLA